MKRNDYQLQDKVGKVSFMIGFMGLCSDNYLAMDMFYIFIHDKDKVTYYYAVKDYVVFVTCYNYMMETTLKLITRHIALGDEWRTFSYGIRGFWNDLFFSLSWPNILEVEPTLTLGWKPSNLSVYPNT